MESLDGPSGFIYWYQKTLLLHITKGTSSLGVVITSDGRGSGGDSTPYPLPSLPSVVQHSERMVLNHQRIQSPMF